MKGLSIEQKAKRYDEALEKSKRLYEQGTITESLCYVFPELAESEDERIREQIVYAINKLNVPESEKNKLLAWFEKQGEKPVIEMKSPEESLGIPSKEYNEIVNECLYGEQKPADKVEPKFKVGEIGYENVNIYPETKEQRALLFAKMKEAGYKWDAEKKELIKIEQKPAWSEKDEKMCQETIDWF